MTRLEYRRLRLAAGLTQKALAERLGIAKDTVARRERGERPISDEAAHAVRRVCQ